MVRSPKAKAAATANPLSMGVVIGAIAVVLVVVGAAAYFTLFNVKRGVRPTMTDSRMMHMYAIPGGKTAASGLPGR